MPTMNSGRSAPAMRSIAACSASTGGAISRLGTRPAGPPGRWPVGGEVLHLVGKHQVGHVALQQRRLAGQVDQLGVVGTGEHAVGRAGHGREGGVQVDILEGAAADDLGRHLARQRQHRGPVGLGIVETGEQVGRARAGDAETRRQAPGQLAVGAGRERCRAFVADADEGELAPLLGGAEGVGQTQIGMAHHAEDMGDAPVDHRLDHHIRHRADPGDLGSQGDIDAVVADLGAVAGRRVGEAWGRGAVARRVVVAVPRTAQPPLFDRPFAKGPALVGAAVVEGAVTAPVVGERQRAVPDSDRLDPALGQLVGLERLVPGVAPGPGRQRRRLERRFGHGSRLGGSHQR